MTRTEPNRERVHPQHVLIVEDHPDGRESLRLLLELLGYQVDVAADGIEGVHKALQGRPEVAIVDLALPRLDGYQVARRLRAALGPSVFLNSHTSNGRPEDRQRALEAGFDVHLVKPVDPGELLACLETATGRD